MDEISNVETVSGEDFPGLVKVAQNLGISLVIPDFDTPVVVGIEGFFCEANIPPSKETAQLKGFKAFSKEFMARHNIPTVEYRNFTDYESMKEYGTSISHGIVVKASSLAVGKGVVIPETQEEMLQALKVIMLDHKFGDAGTEVIIAEFLEGDELSIFTFSDGTTFKSMPPAQDHNRIFDGDHAIKIASQTILQQIDNQILRPTFDGLRKEGN